MTDEVSGSETQVAASATVSEPSVVETEETFSSVFNEIANGRVSSSKDDSTPTVSDKASAPKEKAAKADGADAKKAPVEGATATEKKADTEGKKDSGDESLDDLPEPARKLIERERAERERAEHKFNSHAGRVQALTKQVNDLKQALDKAGKASPSEEQMQTALETPEGFKELEEDFPAIANVMKAFAQDIQRQSDEKLNKRLKSLREQVDADLEPFKADRAEHRANQAVDALTLAHGDWREVVNKKEFDDWLNTQTQMTNDKWGSTDVQDNIDVLDLYKAKTGYKRSPAATSQKEPEEANPGPSEVDVIQQSNREKLEAATVPEGKSGSAGSGMPSKDEYAFSYYAEKADKRLNAR